MSIRPIDIVMMPPKSQEVSLRQGSEHQKADSIHAQNALQFSKDVQHNNKQTIKTTESQNNEFRYDAKEKGNNTDNYKKKNGDKKKKEQTKDNELKNSGIDIKI